MKRGTTGSYKGTKGTGAFSTSSLNRFFCVGSKLNSNQGAIPRARNPWLLGTVSFRTGISDFSLVSRDAPQTADKNAGRLHSKEREEGEEASSLQAEEIPGDVWDEVSEQMALPLSTSALWCIE